MSRLRGKDVPRTESRLRRPAAITLEDGSQQLNGSITQMSGGGELSAVQRRKILVALNRGVSYASGLAAEVGISPFNPSAVSNLHGHLIKLEAAGHAFFQRSRGWTLTPAGVAAIPKKESDE